MPPMIFEDAVDTEGGRAVSVSQPPHLVLTSQISLHTPVVPLQTRTRKALLLRQDMPCQLLPP
jgi:hypothetical protein